MVDEDKTSFDDVVEDASQIIIQRQQAYHLLFGEGKSVHAEIILKDLARFCRANRSTFNSDARIHAVFEGRREVWLRIQEHLTLSATELIDKTLSKWGINGTTSSRANNTSDNYRSGTAEHIAGDDDNDPII